MPLPQSAAPSRPRLDVATVRRALEAKGISLSRLSDANLRDLGLTREQVEGRASKAPAEDKPRPAAKEAKKPRAKPGPSPRAPALPAEGGLAETLALIRESGRTPPAWCDASRLVFKVRLDSATPSLNEMRKLHFAQYKKLRESYALQVARALGGYPAPLVERSGLLVVRYAASSGLDWDNAYGGLKPALDCLVQQSTRNPSGLGIVVDDNNIAMREPPYVFQHEVLEGGATDLFVFKLD